MGLDWTEPLPKEYFVSDESLRPKRGSINLNPNLKQFYPNLNPHLTQFNPNLNSNLDVTFKKTYTQTWDNFAPVETYAFDLRGSLALGGSFEEKMAAAAELDLEKIKMRARMDISREYDLLGNLVETSREASGEA